MQHFSTQIQPQHVTFDRIKKLFELKNEASNKDTNHKKNLSKTNWSEKFTQISYFFSLPFIGRVQPFFTEFISLTLITAMSSLFPLLIWHKKKNKKAIWIKEVWFALRRWQKCDKNERSCHQKRKWRNKVKKLSFFRHWSDNRRERFRFILMSPSKKETCFHVDLLSSLQDKCWYH